MGLQILMPHVELQLRELAEQLVAACPDMRQLARESAIAILKKHRHPELDPDQVYLNRFKTAQSSPHTFSGWQHLDPPYQSFTLPQLVMHRFDVHDQDNSDLLSYLTGFYSNGDSPGVYDEHNEIPIEPQQVLSDFWRIDFSADFHRRLDTFWQHSAEDYRVLTKVNFLSKVIETCAADSTSKLAQQARRVAKAITGLDIASPTLEQLQAVKTPEPGYRLCTFDIGGHVASDFLRIVMEDGSQLLYTPGESETLHLFPTRKDLYWWLLNTTNEADNRARFMAHFPLSALAQNGDKVGLNHMIDLLFFNWGGDDHHSLNQLDSSLSGDAFSHLRDAARQRMTDDAHIALRSNSDLRKQMWIGYFKAFGEAFGPMAAVDWPIALAAVGAGLADMGLNIDQAINGHTTGERQAGVTGAIFAAIDTLFNAAMLASTAGESALIETPPPSSESPPPLVEEHSIEDLAPATAGEIKTWIPEPFQPTPEHELLKPFKTNMVLSAESGSGGHAGIYRQDGKFYALVDGQPYLVRYVTQMNTWVVIDPQNPYSFYRNVPLRMTEQGNWLPQQRAGLQGGALPRKLLALWGRRATAPALEALPDTPYEIPTELRPSLASAANAPGEERSLSGVMVSFDPEVERIYREFRKVRDRLALDAGDYLDNVIAPRRPDLAPLAADASAKQIIRGIYQDSQGLVIGESHSQLGSKKFLIDNMALLKREKVKVLYLEHFMTDFQQADLDLFNRSGILPADLKLYVDALDDGYGIDTSGRYTFTNLLVQAQKEGIRLQSIDCMASYRQAWNPPPSEVIRQKMMNFYAHEIIEADQAVRGRGKWVALVGNTHSNTFEGVLGVSELQGATGLRVEDVAINQPGTVGPDPGLAVILQNLSVRTTKGDLRLRVPIRAEAPASSQLPQRLRDEGMFTFVSVDDQLELVHRSKTGELVHTSISQKEGRLSIHKPNWPWISDRQLGSLNVMRSMLERQGLRYMRH